jgi:hypothetical protein
MATRTWKLGEYSKGGVITAVATKRKITIIGKEWDYSNGTNKSSNQSNAKEWTRLEMSGDLHTDYVTRELTMFLNDLTTSYYTDMILEWCESKSDLNKKLIW